MTDRINTVPLENGINAVHEALDIVSRQVEYVDARVGSVETNLGATRSELQELRRILDGYIMESERTAKLQRAETRAGNLKAQLQAEFGHYSHVRKASVGTLQALDVGNISLETVSQISEELMLQTPKYWLAPALVALAAWARDEEETCRISVGEAFKRDESKTSLFFAIVLQRQNRIGEAYRWLETYLRLCNSKALTRDFAVVFEATSQGVFGPQAAKLVYDYLARWQKELRSDYLLVKAQVAEWSGKISANKQTLIENDVSALKELSPDFARIKANIEAASALSPTQTEYSGVKSAEVDKGAILDRLDDLLELLVTGYDEDELPLRRELAQNQAIIDANGDSDEAEEQFKRADGSLAETFDAVTFLTKIAVNPRDLGVSVPAQRIAVATGIEDFKRGAADFCADYRSNYIDETKLVLGAEHSSFTSAVRFTEFVTSTAEDEAQCLARLEQHWNTLFQPSFEELRFRPSQLARTVVVGLVLTMLAFIIGPGLGAIAAALTVGWSFWKFKALDRASAAKMEQLELTRGQAVQASREKILDARAEFTDLKYEYQDFDAEERHLRDLLEKWPR